MEFDTWITAAFDGAVDHRGGAAGERGDRRGVDDGPATVCRHVPGGALAADDDAPEVHRHHPLVVGEVVVEEACEPAADAGVVDHHVQPAEALDREVDEPLHVVGVGDVGPPERDGIAERRCQRLALLRVDVGDRRPVHPRRRSSSAVACPIPLAPPVTIATFPPSSPAAPLIGALPGSAGA